MANENILEMRKQSTPQINIFLTKNINWSNGQMVK